MYQTAIEDRRGADRRVARFAFRYPDRRRGFVRRQADLGRLATAHGTVLAAYRSKPQVLAIVLAAIATLNIADLLLTIRALELGAAELNPIMAALLETNLAVASAFKVTIGVAVVAAMWLLRRYRLVLELSLVILAGFIVLTTYSATSLLLAG